MKRTKNDPRWLTSKAKETVLQSWVAQRAEPMPPGDLAGKGFPDTDILPLCDELNSLDGVCTLQSCAGHRGCGGHLWLWLDRATSRAFDELAHQLAEKPGIERVSRIYASWGQEITAIEFDDRFSNACSSVLEFFTVLIATCGNRQPCP